MSTRARERVEGGAHQHQTPSGVTQPAANKTRTRKVSPVLEPEDDTEDEDDEVDETFLALQKLLMNMEGNRLSQVAPVSLNSHVIHANSGNSNATTPVSVQQSSNSNNTSSNTNASHRRSQEEILESRRREREQFRHLLLSKGSAGQRRGRRPAHNCFDEEDEEDEAPAPSVESTISNRMMNGSFSRYSVHAISRDRWAKEDPERLPLVLLPKDGKISSPADNPKLNVIHTAEYIDLGEQMEAKLQDELKDHVCYLTPPRSTWCIQMRDFEALHC